MRISFFVPLCKYRVTNNVAPESFYGSTEWMSSVGMAF